MKRFLISAGALLALAGPAAAGEYAAVGHWSVGMYDTHCAAGANYQNGTGLALGVDTDGNAWMSVSDPAWRIPPGSYAVQARVDGTELDDLTFKSDRDPRVLTNSFVLNEAAYNYLTRGSVLSLTFGGTVLSYRLQDTAAMFPKLLACVGALVRKANPFAGQPAQEKLR